MTPGGNLYIPGIGGIYFSLVADDIVHPLQLQEYRSRCIVTIKLQAATFQQYAD